MAPDPGSTDLGDADASPGSAGTGSCESCGDEAVEVVTVRRLYLVPATDTDPQRYDHADVEERWCFVCRTHYPHEVVE